MKRSCLLVLVLLLLAGLFELHAAVIHLHTGESLQGRIRQMDDTTLTLESNSGFGVLQIEKAQIRLIEFEGQKQDFTRKIGLGYYQRGLATNGKGKAEEYSIGALSLKYWTSHTDAVQLQMGYAGTSQGSEKLLEIVQIDARYSQVMIQEGNQNIYWGAGMGYLGVVDDDVELDDNGLNIQGFLGIEIFLATLPNLGISGEIGVISQNVGDRRSFALFNSGFPTLAVHYYF